MDYKNILLKCTSSKNVKTFILKIIAVGVFITAFYSCKAKQEEVIASTISFSPTSGSVGTLMTITSSDSDLLSPITVSVGGVNAIVLESTSTSIKVLSLSSATGAVVVTQSTGAAITSTSDFTFAAVSPVAAQQGAKLVGTGNTGAARQGTSVALSADGNTALVGGVGDSTNQGAAWVYTRSAGVWSQQGTKLVGTGNTGNAYQGQSVALSADGNTAIVGGLADNTYVGAFWVFTRSAGVWTQQGAKLVGTGNVGAAKQGQAVSLSADGNTALVGGHADDSNQGAVWVFTRSAGVWTQQGSKLVGTGNTGAAYQGVSVSLSADGHTALVGGYDDNSSQGAVWVFTRSAGVWTQQGSKLVGTGNTGTANQGVSVSLSADGNTALIGGHADNTSLGAAWVFTRSAGVWAQQGAKLVGTGNAGTSLQGASVSLSADGNMALVGGYMDASNLGAAWVFTRSAGVWTQGAKLVGTGNTGNARQGYSVSLSADGNTALAGGYLDSSNQGAAWVFVP